MQIQDEVEETEEVEEAEAPIIKTPQRQRVYTVSDTSPVSCDDHKQSAAGCNNRIKGGRKVCRMLHNQQF